MLSSLAMALNLHLRSKGRYTFSPFSSKQRRKRLLADGVDAEDDVEADEVDELDEEFECAVEDDLATTSPSRINVSPVCMTLDRSRIVSVSSLLETKAWKVSRTTTESGKRENSSATLSIHLFKTTM